MTIEDVMSTPIIADANFTQVITVTTAGTPVQGPNVSNPGGWCIKTDPGSTGNAWLMFHGQTKAAKGFPLGPGNAYPLKVENLSSFDFDADANGRVIYAAKL